MKKLWALRYVFILLVASGLVVALAYRSITSYPTYSAGAVVLVTAMFGVQSWRIKRRNDLRGWRVRCVRAGVWAYEEKRHTGWDGIQLDELGDFRETPHLIGVPDVKTWAKYPDWIAGRRDEVIARIETELRRPAYQISNG